MAVITISRQFGAGGRTLGKMIAKELGYTFADQQIIQKIAESANVSPHWVESIEKEAGTRLTKIIDRMVSMRWIERVLKEERGYIDEEIYLDYLVVIVSQIAEEGNSVIIGRGSQYILNDHPDTRHVLLINEVENRVQFMMKHYDLSRKQAEKIVTKEDKRRINFYGKLGKADFDNPDFYHMVLNMGRVNMETALGLVVQLVRS
jgi:cytidylate kinase